MASKPMRIPGPEHPITIKKNPARVVVKVARRTLADSTNALSMEEGNYPAVQYIPRKDSEMSLLVRTDHTTYCPYKGDCSYFSIPGAGERGRNAVWRYEAPHGPVAAIKEHLAFYPDRVDSIEVVPR